MEKSLVFPQDTEDIQSWPGTTRTPLRASFSDWLRPGIEEFLAQLNSGEGRVFYQDRVLVKRLPQPPASRIIAGPEQDLRDMAWREGSEHTGIQRGLVIATAAGNTGLSILRYGPRGEKIKKFLPFPNGLVTPCECQPGDVVLYDRVPPQEFEYERETYTFVYEEQHILAVLEGA